MYGGKIWKSCFQIKYLEYSQITRGELLPHAKKSLSIPEIENIRKIKMIKISCAQRFKQIGIRKQTLVLYTNLLQKNLTAYSIKTRTIRQRESLIVRIINYPTIKVINREGENLTALVEGCCLHQMIDKPAKSNITLDLVLSCNE